MSIGGSPRRPLFSNEYDHKSHIKNIVGETNKIMVLFEHETLKPTISLVELVEKEFQSRNCEERGAVGEPSDSFGPPMMAQGTTCYIGGDIQRKAYKYEYTWQGVTAMGGS